MQLTGLERNAKIELGHIIVHFVASQQTHWLNRETGRRVTLQTGQAINERTNEVYNGFFVIRINGLAVWAGTNSDIFTTPLVGRGFYRGMRYACRLLACSSHEGNQARFFIDQFVPQMGWSGQVWGAPPSRRGWNVNEHEAMDVEVFNA
jgi:hypothetical protein